MSGEQCVQIAIPGTRVHGDGDVIVLHAQVECAQDVGVGDAPEERGVLHKLGNLLIVAAFFQP